MRGTPTDTFHLDSHSWTCAYVRIRIIYTRTFRRLLGELLFCPPRLSS